MEKAQIVQVRNKAAAAFLGKSCAEIFFVQRNIVCYHLQTQFRIGIVILQKSDRFLDTVGSGAGCPPGTGIFYPAQKSPQPERKLCHGMKTTQFCCKIFFLRTDLPKALSILVQFLCKPSQQSTYCHNWLRLCCCIVEKAAFFYFRLRRIAGTDTFQQQITLFPHRLQWPWRHPCAAYRQLLFHIREPSVSVPRIPVRLRIFVSRSPDHSTPPKH